ncbi:hypothetical protein [Pelobacter propionicus]|uniref:hypothetical protein n=1 Tax=Pelobacter propionicus TaxID=29543 RepID=UPI0002DE2FF0|nr:hypothetical protein [Pelobacter propionicus]
MTTAAAHPRRGKEHRTASVRATWEAFRGIRFHHFPLLLPGVHPLLAPLIMFRLKRRGFSCCSVVASRIGLTVYAER